MKVFELVWSGQEWEKTYKFIAPDNAKFGDFKKLCDKLMDEAALDFLETNSDLCVGYPDLVELVVDKLEKLGLYKKIDFLKVVYREGFLIRSKSDDNENLLSEETLEKVIEHNNKLWRK